MKAKRRMSTIGAGAAAAVAVAMLAALPAHAGSGLIKITHSDTPYKRAVKPASSTVAKAQPAASQAKPAEIQVGVMAKSPSQPAAKHAVFIRR